MLCLARVDALDFSKGIGKSQGPPRMLMILCVLMRVTLEIPWLPFQVSCPQGDIERLTMLSLVIIYILRLPMLREGCLSLD
jgi:hypothetical protein